MATLTIRKLDDPIKRRLRLRAAEHGVSMEEEARSILRAALSFPVDRPSDGGAHAAAPAPGENPEGWRLEASFDEIMSYGAKPPVEFDQKAVSDELYAYLDQE